MATIVKEPLLNCKHSRRWRRKKFIAILLFAFFLIALVSYLASGKSSRKLHKNIHRLEDKFEDLQESYKSTTLAFQRDIEALKLERKYLLQTSTKHNQNTTSSEIEKTIYQKLNQTQQELKEQKETMKSLFTMFESYKEETNKELSELKNMHINDQQEIQRLQSSLRQFETQKHQNKVVNEKKEFNSSSKAQAQAQAQAQVQHKDSFTRFATSETKPKSSSNILVRGAKAVKDYISNLAFKLNPFRSSRDKTPNNRPTYKENNISIALEGTIKKSLEGMKSEGSQTEKNITWLTKDIDVTLENLVSLLNTAESLDNPIEMLKRIESKFHHLEIVMADYVEKKSHGKDHERALKWRKNYIPIKEQFEKIKHENTIHGSKSHKHSSKNLQKLSSMTRNLKDTLHSLI